jgi:tetratricopeptide (TPR) repeat protein
MFCRRSLAALLFFCCLASGAGAQQTTYRTELDLGVQAYKGAKYEEAIAHFRQATAAAPEQSKAHLYLATAYAQQYIPGVETPENTAVANQAIAEFESVLSLKAPQESELAALKGIASLYFNMKKLDQAREYHMRAAKLDPNDPETYYAIGVIDWTESYQLVMEEKAHLALKPDQPLISAESCWKIRDANAELVKDGLEMLTKSLSLRPDYDDAMAYMNLMYRQRAEIECGNKQAYVADTNAADKWVDLTMATKKAKAERPARKPQEQ